MTLAITVWYNSILSWQHVSTYPSNKVVKSNFIVI